jgi:DNA-binding transcriptional regulator YbjK
MSEVQELNLKPQSITSSAPVKRRSKGENTKHLILKAAVDVLAKQGIKGTTHRAVASQANLQLSLTTYYFKDIQELVHEAFVLACEDKNRLINSAWDSAFTVIESYDKTSLRKVPVKTELCEKLSEMAAQYLFHKIQNFPVYLKVEQLLFAEMHFNPTLKEVGEQHRKDLATPFIKFCRYFNKKSPEIDADIMLTMFAQLEYRHLSMPSEDVRIDDLRAVTRRIIGLLMSLKNNT